MLSMMCARRSMASTSVSGSMSGDDSSSRNSAGLMRSPSVTLHPFSSVPCSKGCSIARTDVLQAPKTHQTLGYALSSELELDVSQGVS